MGMALQVDSKGGCRQHVVGRRAGASGGRWSKARAAASHKHGRPLLWVGRRRRGGPLHARRQRWRSPGNQPLSFGAKALVLPPRARLGGHRPARLVVRHRAVAARVCAPAPARQRRRWSGGHPGGCARAVGRCARCCHVPDPAPGQRGLRARCGRRAWAGGGVRRRGTCSSPGGLRADSGQRLLAPPGRGRLLCVLSCCAARLHERSGGTSSLDRVRSGLRHPSGKLSSAAGSLGGGPRPHAPRTAPETPNAVEHC